MIDLLIYLLAVCQCQAQELVAAQAVIDLQSNTIDSVFLDLDRDMEVFEKEMDNIEEILKKEPACSTNRRAGEI